MFFYIGKYVSIYRSSNEFYGNELDGKRYIDKFEICKGKN